MEVMEAAAQDGGKGRSIEGAVEGEKSFNQLQSAVSLARSIAVCYLTASCDKNVRVSRPAVAPWHTTSDCLCA